MSAAVAATAVAGSLLTDPDSAWYRSLRKPSWQPPASAFPIVWTGLYAIIAVATTAAITEAEEAGDLEKAAGLRRSLAVNLPLNAAWSGIFFRSRNLPAATLGAAALAASSADLARRAATPGSGKAVGLGLYAVWCGFATALSAELARLNR